MSFASCRRVNVPRASWTSGDFFEGRAVREVRGLPLPGFAIQRSYRFGGRGAPRPGEGRLVKESPLLRREPARMKPELLVMAAGVASRYGALKQIETVGPSGETLMDFAVYDALRAGV